MYRRWLGRSIHHLEAFVHVPQFFLVLPCLCIRTHSSQLEKSILPSHVFILKTHYPIPWDHTYDNSSPIPPTISDCLVLVGDLKLFVDGLSATWFYFPALFSVLSEALRLSTRFVRRWAVLSYPSCKPFVLKPTNMLVQVHVDVIRIPT